MMTTTTKKTRGALRVMASVMLGLCWLSGATVSAQPKENLNEHISAIKSKWSSDKEADVKKVDDACTALAAAAANADDKAKILKALKNFKEQAAAKAVTEAITKSGVTRSKLRAILVKGRPAALEAIFNPRYTESDSNSLQPKVDEVCQPLIEIWNDPVNYAAKNMKLDIATPGEKLDKLAKNLDAIDADLGKWEGCSNAQEYMRKVGAPSFNIKREELEENDSLQRQNDAQKDKLITDATRQNIRAVNDYRMMLGKKALILELTLTKAAQGHAKYLESVKKVGHNFDDHPDGRTPKDRCGKAGYGNANVGENCGRAADAQAIVWVWYKAAEHHRGMVMGWEYVGSGNAGEYWVLNFGGGDGDRSGEITRK